MVNVKVAERFDPMTKAEISDAVSRAEARLVGAGRVLLRASGTEPLIRVMVEGDEAELVDQLVEELAVIVKAAV